jgi:hypothetical protein
VAVVDQPLHQVIAIELTGRYDVAIVHDALDGSLTCVKGS